jgi:hypothetical protein
MWITIILTAGLPFIIAVLALVDHLTTAKKVVDQKTKPNIRIRSTVKPDHHISFNEWADHIHNHYKN